MALVIVFHRIKTPQHPVMDRLSRLDWMCVLIMLLQLSTMLIAHHSGNGLIVASTASVIIALTFGGLRFSWSSFHVLVPLCLGLAGVCTFFVYEALISSYPTVRHLWSSYTM